MINKIKLGLANYVLKRRVRGLERNRELKNLMDCHSVIILANDDEDRNGAESAQLSNFLRQHKKEVFTLIYTTKKDYNKDDYTADIKVIERSHLNRLLIPVDTELQQLLSREVDLLIDLSLNEVFPLKYMQVVSMAKLKVGPAMNYKKEHSDLTIDISKQQNIGYLITQIKHYLTQINSKTNGI